MLNEKRHPCKVDSFLEGGLLHPDHHNFELSQFMLFCNEVIPVIRVLVLNKRSTKCQEKL